MHPRVGRSELQARLRSLHLIPRFALYSGAAVAKFRVKGSSRAAVGETLNVGADKVTGTYSTDGSLTLTLVLTSRLERVWGKSPHNHPPTDDSCNVWLHGASAQAGPSSDLVKRVGQIECSLALEADATAWHSGVLQLLQGKTVYACTS